MKLWNGYSSEHSMNLVMIGHFKEFTEVESAKQLIDKLTEQVQREPDQYRHDAPKSDRRFSKEMLDLLIASEIHSIGPIELEQFNYENRLEIDGNKLILTTDEVDVSAFLKILLDKGARVEIYSAHEHTETAYGRGK